MSIIDKSFIMIRPDGGQILDGIDNMIKTDGFDITDVYHINKWDDLYLALHEKELNNKDNIVADNVKLNIWMSKQIYGNNGLLLLLRHPKAAGILELVDRTFELKFKIRDKFQNTRDGKFVIAINASLIDINMQHLLRDGKLVVIGDNNKVWDFSERMPEKGNYVPAYFNYIHCPERGLEEITEEYNIMNKKKILTLDNKMSSGEYENCKLMHSCYRNRGY
jgi:hypothetical protein